MPLPGLSFEFARLAAPVPISRAVVSRRQWRSAASVVRGLGGRLVALWGTDRQGIDEGGDRFSVSAAYATADGLVWLELPVGAGVCAYPGIADVFPAAARMQRATADLLGLTVEDAGPGAVDRRPWLRHAAWPADYFPLRHEKSGQERFESATERYPFVPVEGDGVHEIAVGPVHAGIIEPGHFRFSVVGEKVLRLEERLGYKHKGIERLFESMRLDDGAGPRLAGRVSGDSTVAYAWAFSMAAEALCAAPPPPRAQWLRALALERERVANHLGDLGALGNDAAFAFGLAQFSRLKEDWLRAQSALVGHRFMMDWIVPGGVASDLTSAGLDAIARQCDTIAEEVRRLRSIYDEHAGLQDRFVGAGTVTADLARRLGLTGLAARASGVRADLRVDLPFAPYDELQVQAAAADAGDVAARVAVRFDEVFESLRLVRQIATRLPQGAVRAPLGAPQPGGRGAGWVEGWRGEVLVAIELDRDGRIRRCHCHDPSWQNWPVLEHAVIGNIVPDFPLINKSFNLSYSGQDL